MTATDPRPQVERTIVLDEDRHAPVRIPVARADAPDPETVLGTVEEILRGGQLTNGLHVRELERLAAERLGVRHCVAVASCTSGLMLVLRATGLTGEVVVPSFSFAATAHAVVWAGLRPRFADIDPDTLTLDPEAVERAAGVQASAVLATHTFGTPCAVDELQEVADALGLRLFYDAAHAFGSEHAGRPIGTFGDAEVFSLSPTKLLVGVEGGLIATDDDVLAERCRIGRDYGNPGDYDCRLVGLNARMSELHAVVALASLGTLDARLDRRNQLAQRYHRALADVPGISFPLVPAGDRSTFKDLTVLVDAETFGIDAADLAGRLGARGIDTRRYYTPPIHRMRAYRDVSAPGVYHLPVTDAVAEQVLTLPFWSAMDADDVDEVALAVSEVQAEVDVGPYDVALP